MAQATGRSVARVRKWLAQLTDTAFDGSAALATQPCKPKTRGGPTKLRALVVERILALRDEPPAHLQRTPGPHTLAYFLKDDKLLQQHGLTPPTPSATIYKVLRQHGKIGRKRPRSSKPMALPSPLSRWQLDYKDVITISK